MDPLKMDQEYPPECAPVNPLYTDNLSSEVGANRQCAHGIQVVENIDLDQKQIFRIFKSNYSKSFVSFCIF